MGFFDRFRKKSKEMKNLGSQFAIEFKVIYENSNEYDEKENEKLLNLLDSWRRKCPDDANSRLAQVIFYIERENLFSMKGVESIYYKATTEMSPLDSSLYDWYKNKANNCLNPENNNIQEVSEKIEETGEIKDTIAVNESKQEISSKNFKYLEDLINSGEKEIILDSDILFDSDESISIEENNIVIDGNGHVIDANMCSRIFSISDSEVTIKNVTFQNSKGAISIWDSSAKFIDCCFQDNINEGSGGGAISSHHSCLYFVDCNFIHNSAALGGAVHNNSFSESENLIFKNCNFHYNWSKSNHEIDNWHSYTDSDYRGGHGGAIYSYGNIQLENCVFDQNHADILGGAIFVKDNEKLKEKPIVNIVECKFLRNFSYKMGGAIYNKTYSYLDNCYFEGNHIKPDDFIKFHLSYGKYNINYGYDDRLLGGAISSFRNIVIENSKFKFNKSECGGAISNFHDMSLKMCIFKNNEAKNGGGAIINASSKYSSYSLQIEKCNFLDNISESKGESIFNEDESTKILCSESTFKNSKELSYHSVIYNENELDINKCEFLDNQNCDYILYQSKNRSSFLSIQNSVFKSNSVLNELICIDDGFCSIKLSEFNDNESIYLVNNKGITSIDKLKFKRNLSKIVFNKNVLKFSNKDFYDEIVGMIGSSEDAHSQVKEDVRNIHGFSFLEECIKNKSEIFLECDILMDEAEQDFFEGGIELNRDDLIIDGQNHIIDANNLSRIFYITGKNITLKNIIFKNGMYFKSPLSSKYDGGGAICVLHDASVSIENCEFIHNISMKSAGAIKDYGGISKLNNSIFKNNIAEEHGGAFLNSNKELTVQDCIFEENFSKNDGGAIFSNIYLLSQINNDEDIEEIKSHNYKHSYNLYLDKCLFKDNSTQHSGGVIQANDLNLECTNCNFEGNFIGEFDKMNDASDYSAGAISANFGNYEFKDCNFVNNNSKYEGGAIRFNGSHGKLINCNFENNIARQGGAIYGNHSILVENCKFKKNEAKHFEHGNIFQGSRILLDKILFDSHVNGGAIYGGLNQKNCFFNDNKPNDVNE